MSTISNVLTTTAAGLLGAGLAVGLGMIVIVPAMRDTCMLFDKRCINIEYQTMPTGELLVKNHKNSITYWFDGNYIRSYGPTLPGTCPSTVSRDATGVYEAIGDPRIVCNRFDPNGVCVSWDATATPPVALTGTQLGFASGEQLLEPSFVMNAHTLRASEQQVLCSQARNVVEGAFANIPFRKIKVRLPEGSDSLDVTQLFTVLKHHNAYIPPRTNPEPPVCTGHGKIDPLTTMCICDPGYTGVRCATKMCDDNSQCTNGVCNAGLCTCDAGWTGDACNIKECATSCVNGTCDGSNGTCVCFPGFTGDACTSYTCLPACGPHGTCNTVNGVCECESGWTGTTCDNIACPDNCNGNGMCLAPDGVCECVNGWVGDACETAACINDCSQRGVCDMATSVCVCNDGWTGDDCSISRCPNGCCSHGTCTDNGTGMWSCACDAGWDSATDCGVPDDPLTSAAWCVR